MWHVMKFFVVVLIALPISSFAQDKKDDKDDLKKIQGSWRVVESQHQGKPHPDTKNARLTFEGNQATLTLFDGDKVDKKTTDPFKLDPAKSPKWIDLAADHLGVYKLEADSLTICFMRGKERPTKFEATDGSSAFLLKLKREKP